MSETVTASGSKLERVLALLLPGVLLSAILYALMTLVGWMPFATRTCPGGAHVYIEHGHPEAEKVALCKAVEPAIVLATPDQSQQKSPFTFIPGIELSAYLCTSGHCFWKVLPVFIEHVDAATIIVHGHMISDDDAVYVCDRARLVMDDEDGRTYDGELGIAPSRIGKGDNLEIIYTRHRPLPEPKPKPKPSVDKPVELPTPEDGRLHLAGLQ